MANYDGTSPWFNTTITNNQYLDTLKIRPIPAESDDVLYTVQVQYTHRPDLLAFDVAPLKLLTIPPQYACIF